MRQVLLIVILLFSPLAHASESIVLVDKSRNREIPLEIYEPEIQQNRRVVFINHGYGVKNTEYTFLAEHFAKLGFLVISIQHDLENDPPLPRSGNIFKLRIPFWNQGVKSLEYTINKLSLDHPNYNWHSLILIGHSNGGDIAMMYADKNRDKVAKAISLDSLRYPLPANSTTLSFRADDTEADEGVLPSSDAKIINLNGALHIDMYDSGPDWVKAAIIKDVDLFLNIH